jgi:hypothetical protein
MICFICNCNCNCINELKNHFISTHNLSFINSNCKGLFVCKENNCNSSFTLFSSFRRHVQSKHADHLPNNPPTNPPSLPDNIAEEQNEPPDLENINDNHMTFDLCKGLINKVVCEIRCKTSLPESTVSFIVNAMLKIAIIISTFLRSQFTQFLNIMNIDTNSAHVRLMMNCFDVGKMFKNTSSFAQQVKYNLFDIDYIQPEEIFLGQRVDTVIKNGNNTTKIVNETCQYISITRTLSSLLRNTNLQTLVDSEATSIRDPETYKSYMDGEHYQKSEFLQKFKKTLRINLYYDDIEVANPIGSASAVYKIACFYYTIQNASPLFNSKLDNIFILAIAYNTDLKKYGYSKVLRKFVEEMQQLESEEGVTVIIKNQSLQFHAILSSFIGDTLAANDILGFSGPSSTHFCRQCMINRKDFHANPLHDARVRTVTTHKRQLEHLIRTDYDAKVVKKYGVKEDSILNSLKNFHCTTNYVFDPMHDLLEGVVPMTIKLILKHLIQKRKLFTVFDFNARIEKFRYGVEDTKNRPAANFTSAMLNSKSNKLKQKSAQCWLLLRVFPFLIGHLLEECDLKYLDQIADLIKICSISFSTTVDYQTVCQLDQTIRRYLLNFKDLFGDKVINGVLVKGVNMINKHHQLRHYLQVIMNKGPIALYSCMRYEGRHYPIKQQIFASHNYINVPKSIAKRQSLLQSFNIKYNCYRTHIPLINSFKIVKVETLKSKNSLHAVFGPLEYIKRVSSCIIHNTRFQKNLVIRLEEENESPFPTLAVIQEILEHDGSIYFYCNQLDIIDIENQYYSFVVRSSQDNILVNSSNLTDFEPCNIWRKYRDVTKYISIKYCFI